MGDEGVRFVENEGRGMGDVRLMSSSLVIGYFYLK